MYACFANAQIATMRPEVIFDGTLTADNSRYRLYILGKPVDLEMQVSNDNPVLVTTRRTRHGVIYGYVGHIESGAVTISVCDTFVQDHGKFFKKYGYATNGHRGESILFIPIQDGPWIQESSAFLYEKGKFVDLGYAHEAGIGKGGKVVGWYYAHKNGTPSGGEGADFDLGTYKQYFEFKNGVRKLIGRKLIYG